jgi:hypothetical protein
VNDTNGNLNQNETVLSLTVYIPQPPSLSYVNVTPDNPITVDDLSCRFLATDPDSSSFFANITWWEDTTQFTGADINDLSVSNNSETYTTTNITLGNTTKGEVWNCSVTIFDSIDSENLNGSETIQNYIPNISSADVFPDSPTNDDNLNCSWIITDYDSDTLTANVTWWNGGDQVTDYDSNDTSCSSGNTCYTTVLVNSTNTTGGEIWTCQITSWDGTVSDQENASETITTPGGPGGGGGGGGRKCGNNVCESGETIDNCFEDCAHLLKIIYPEELLFYNNVSNIFVVKIEYNGGETLHNLRLNFETDEFIASPGINALNPGETFTFIVFGLSDELGLRDVKFSLETDEATFERTLSLFVDVVRDEELEKILREQLSNIEEALKELLDLTVSLIDRGYPLGDVQGELENTESSLTRIRNLIERGEYDTAQSELDKIKEKLTSSAISLLASEGGIQPWHVLLILIPISILILSVYLKRTGKRRGEREWKIWKKLRELKIWNRLRGWKGWKKWRQWKKKIGI